MNIHKNPRNLGLSLVVKQVVIMTKLNIWQLYRKINYANNYLNYEDNVPNDIESAVFILKHRLEV